MVDNTRAHLPRVEGGSLTSTAVGLDAAYFKLASLLLSIAVTRKH
jgi:hypothetical protein